MRKGNAAHRLYGSTSAGNKASRPRERRGAKSRGEEGREEGGDKARAGRLSLFVLSLPRSLPPPPSLPPSLPPESRNGRRIQSRSCNRRKGEWVIEWSGGPSTPPPRRPLLPLALTPSPSSRFPPGLDPRRGLPPLPRLGPQVIIPPTPPPPSPSSILLESPARPNHATAKLLCGQAPRLPPASPREWGLA